MQLSLHSSKGAVILWLRARRSALHRPLLLQALALRLVRPPVRLAALWAAVTHHAAAAAAREAACDTAAGGSADAGRADWEGQGR